MSSKQVFVSDLTTLDDMARRWHMSVGQVSNLASGRMGRRRVKFPQPIAGRGDRAVWLWPEVKEWYDKVQPNQHLAERRAAKTSKKKKEKYIRESYYSAA